MKDLQFRAKKMPATIQVGKRGITDTLVTEIAKQLKQKKLVKIKLLRSFHETIDKDEVARLIADKTDSILVSRRGFIIVLYKGILSE